MFKTNIQQVKKVWVRLDWQIPNSTQFHWEMYWKCLKWGCTVLWGYTTMLADMVHFRTWSKFRPKTNVYQISLSEFLQNIAWLQQMGGYGYIGLVLYSDHDHICTLIGSKRLTNLIQSSIRADTTPSDGHYKITF